MTATRWKLTIEYDGGAFHGWQRQGGLPTVQQAIEDAILGFCQQSVEITGAGRTDAGVHATGQVAHFDLDYGDRALTAYDLAKALNAHLRAQPAAIVAVEPVAPEFHARFGAVNKMYAYRIVNRPARPVRERRLVAHVQRALNVAAMRQAAQHLIGAHDFSTFRDSQCQAKSPVRTLDRLDVTVEPYDDHGGTAITITAEARSFLHHQMRNIAGSLILVGEGKWTPDDLALALAARDRRRGGPTAPPEGLCLVRVDY